MRVATSTTGPLQDLDHWDEFLQGVYPEPPAAEPAVGTFRDYRAEARASVKEFYRLNHLHQTRAFVQAKKREFLPLQRRRMGVWPAMEFLNTLVDDSDPDTSLTQIEHLLQTSEAMRRDGRPRWFILTGLIHDLGKILCLFGEPQWAVVGDTFPVGCAFSDKIVFPEFFATNPDTAVPEYQSELGVYAAGGGLHQVDLSWGHDEYLFHVVKDYLPEPAQYMIRYHSFYAWHREGAYDQLLNERDRAMLPWVRDFNRYDLYSKAETRPDVSALRPYYETLIAEYFPPELNW